MNSEHDKDLVSYYKDKPLRELQAIIPKWSYGKDYNKSLHYHYDPTNERHITCFVNTKELILKVEFEEVSLDQLFNNDSLNNNRIANLLHRWENNKFVDPPEIYIELGELNKLKFSDGRHRTKLAYFLGFLEIPISIDKEDIKEINKIIQIKKTKN